MQSRLSESQQDLVGVEAWYTGVAPPVFDLSRNTPPLHPLHQSTKKRPELLL